ncbi:hypothetical protein ACS0TY_020477 [Phlomoides rotata]
MDSIVDSLNSAYQEFISAAATTLEAKESSGGLKTPAKDRVRVCLVDEATGSVAAKPGQPSPSGLPPISAVRLEQMSKAVRWLVIELQQESGAGGALSHPHSSAPFDARFTDDAAQ